jgi:hypothetical protein
VRNSSYIFQQILNKLSQKLCHQVTWRILSGFCDWIIFDLIMALCFFPYIEYIMNNFFCAQLFLYFSMDFDQTFTEALYLSALAHIVGVLWSDNIWPNYGSLFFSQYRIYSEQFSLRNFLIQNIITVNTSSVAIPPTLFMFYIAHSYIVCCLYLYSNTTYLSTMVIIENLVSWHCHVSCLLMLVFRCNMIQFF